MYDIFKSTISVAHKYIVEVIMKKLLVTLMCVAMVLTLMPAVAFADATTVVTTESELRNALQNGGNVALDANITGISTVEVPEGKTVNLDLNGFKIETTTKTGDPSRHYYAIDNYGKITIDDSSAGGTGEIYARGVENLGNGEMIINGGTFISCDANGGACVWNEAKLTVNGGLFKTVHVGSAGDSVGVGCINNSGTALITGGRFEDVNKRTYAIISTGNITITPAEGKEVVVFGAHGGLAIDSGVAVINGGSYSSEDYYGLYVSNDGKGTIPEDAAVTVNGGTFSGKNYSVWIGSDHNNPVNSTIEIYGGNFEQPLNAQDCTREGAIKIKGGTYSEPPTEFVDPTAYVIDSSTGKFVVAPIATEITLDKTTASIEVGQTITLKATVLPEGTLDTVTWATDKADVATVKDGVVTAVAPGTATITATVNGKTATCKVTVHKATVPKTDDSANMMLWLVLVAIAGVGAVAFKKKED